MLKGEGTIQLRLSRERRGSRRRSSRAVPERASSDMQRVPRQCVGAGRRARRSDRSAARHRPAAVGDRLRASRQPGFGSGLSLLPTVIAAIAALAGLAWISRGHRGRAPATSEASSARGGRNRRSCRVPCLTARRCREPLSTRTARRSLTLATLLCSSNVVVFTASPGYQASSNFSVATSRAVERPLETDRPCPCPCRSLPCATHTHAV